MDMNILKYKAFIKTVEYSSFTKAAKFLNYSQSGISRMINDLEKEWNFTILERNRSGVKLTSDGEIILPYAKELCESYDKLQMQVDNLRGVQTGIIRIGTFSNVATHWLPNIIKEFQKDYKGIDYELLLGDYTEIEEWITNGRVDCGFLRLPCKHNFETIFLEKDKLVAILPENHELTKYEKVPIKLLCNEPFMLLEKGAKAEISKIFEDNDVIPNIRFTTWDDYAIMSMVESGLGVSILPELILKRIPYKIVSKELDVPAYRNIALAIKNKSTTSTTVKKFLDYLNYRHSQQKI